MDSIKDVLNERTLAEEKIKGILGQFQKNTGRRVISGRIEYDIRSQQNAVALNIDIFDELPKPSNLVIPK